MSGAELALAVVGVVPLLVAACEGFILLRREIRTAKKCLKHLGDLYLDLESQRVRFLNECTLLLQDLGEDALLSSVMVHNPAHQNWNSDVLETQIQHRLGASYDLCESILQRIKELVAGVLNQLRNFEIVRLEKKDVRPFLATILTFKLELTYSNRTSRTKSLIDEFANVSSLPSTKATLN
jgi:hypothetical protein